MGFVEYKGTKEDKEETKKTEKRKKREKKATQAGNKKPGKLNFAKHQSFYFREGWLRKGMLHIEEDPNFFLKNDASEILGLGINMVKSLRYWMVATGLATETKSKGKMIQEKTLIGEMIYDKDPYFELDGTLWVIHTQLCSNYEQAPTWYWFFNKYAKALFDREDFIFNLDSWALAEGKKVAQNSLKRDFECFVRTYLFLDFERTPEDIMVCPLGNLGLLERVGQSEESALSKNRKVYRFLRPDIKNIDPLILGWALIKWRNENREGINEISIFEALREDCSPGRLFNLSVAGLLELISRLNEEHPDIGFKIIRTHGLDLIQVPDIRESIYLERYYEMEGLD